MEFIGTFAVLFLLIFAAAILAFLLWNALKSGYARTFDIYVKPCDDLEGFIIHARRDAYIGDIYIMSGAEDEAAKQLSQKYENVKLFIVTGQ